MRGSSANRLCRGKSLGLEDCLETGITNAFRLVENAAVGDEGKVVGHGEDKAGAFDGGGKNVVAEGGAGRLAAA
ncbi:hypothetical protein MLD38_004611 [Melastoma candidum]|uniref:Uncharacterized protein n=1 Tax=Melastoma candidum TaxID=119954 RepID=A0ACB9S7K4_9MYRT|nr:hypothetical protein MLD38_004611 [Melastoma candidum]